MVGVGIYNYLIFLLIFFNSSFSFADEYIDLKKCRNKISQAVCLIEPPGKDEVEELRECEDGGQQYVPEFEKVFDYFPVSLKATFCFVEKIFIEKANIDSSAYSRPSRYGLGATIGFRKDILDKNLSLAEWMTWKIQLPFGADPLKIEINSSIPLKVTKLDECSKNCLGDGPNDFLYFLTAHELAHLIDDSNKFNDQSSCLKKDCSDFDTESFSAISWVRGYHSQEKKIQLKDPLTDGDQICFYQCTNHIGIDRIRPMYEELKVSTLISAYSAMSPLEDFADSFAWIVTERYLKSNYLVTYNGGVMDMAKQIHSAQFSDKYSFIMDVLRREALNFP